MRNFLIKIIAIILISQSGLTHQYAWDSSRDHLKYNFTAITQKALNDHGHFLLDTRDSANLTATGNICPNYNNMNTRERLEFYTALIAEIAQRESGFRINAVANEANFKPVQSKGYSVGLMQLSYDKKVAKAYGCNEVSSLASLKNPLINLTCTVKIMNLLIKRDKVLRNDTDHVGSLFNGKTADLTRVRWKGVAAFWSPLRFEYWRDRAKLSRTYLNNKKTLAKAKDVEKIRTVISNKPYCKR